MNRTEVLKPVGMASIQFSLIQLSCPDTYHVISPPCRQRRNLDRHFLVGRQTKGLSRFINQVKVNKLKTHQEGLSVLMLTFCFGVIGSEPPIMLA